MLFPSIFKVLFNNLVDPMPEKGLVLCCQYETYWRTMVATFKRQRRLAQTYDSAFG
jgi:hypothetical protein